MSSNLNIILLTATAVVSLMNVALKECVNPFVTLIRNVDPTKYVKTVYVKLVVVVITFVQMMKLASIRSVKVSNTSLRFRFLL